MSELVELDPTGRFSVRAGLYARHRPDYPAAAIDWIVTQSGLVQGDVVVDVGCGTGISSRLFAARGFAVIGIEPNEAMRLQAENDSAGQGIAYRPGQAEATGLNDAQAHLVLAAQAFHWFTAPVALAEFHRILRPGGHVALVWNERDESHPATAAYGAAIRLAPDAPLIEGARVRAGEVLLEEPAPSAAWFTAGQRVDFVHEQVVDEPGLLGRAFSASYVPKTPPWSERIATALHEVFARFHEGETIRLRYTTTVFLARRNGSPGQG